MAMAAVRKHTPIRVGVLRDSGSRFRRIANLGLIADGGVWIQPASIPVDGWRYGNYVPRADQPAFLYSPDAVETTVTPKLHYHCSGMTSVSRTGAALESRRAVFPGLASRPRTQIMSVVAGRTWDYPDVRPRRGDVFLVQEKWPDYAMFTVTVHLTTPDEALRLAKASPSDAAGLLDGDPERYVVDLSAHGISGVLSIRLAARDDSDLPLPLGYEPTFCASAFSWSAHERPRESFILCSSNVRNPLVPIETDADLAPITHFTGETRLLPPETEPDDASDPAN